MRKTQLRNQYLPVALLCFAFLVPSGADAQVKFRNPLDTNPSITAYFDNNYSSGLSTYWCSTSASYTYENHRGTDFSASPGTAVYAAVQGTPYYSKSDCPNTGSPSCGGSFGNHVRMDHEGGGTDGDNSGLMSIYAHMTQWTPIPATSQPTYCGAYLGQSGQSGQVTGPHMHFEIRPSGYFGSTRRDPFAGSCSQPASDWYATTGTTPPNITPTTQCQPLPLWPTNLSVDVVSASSLRLNFKDNAFDESAIHIERKTGTGSWVSQGYFSALSGTQSWNWTQTSGISAGQTYCYRLRAQNSYGYSMYSNEACGTPQSGSVVLPAPNNVSVTDPTSNSLRLNFKDNATNETNILVERKTGPNGSWTSLGGFGALSGTSNWTWVNTGLSPKTTYCYRLRAADATNASAYSTEACGATL